MPLLGAALAMVLTKGGVACCTVSYCQRRIGLIPRGPLLQLGLAVAVGALFYLLGHNHLPRTATEALALAPVLAVAARWWLAGKKSPDTSVL